MKDDLQLLGVALVSGMALAAAAWVTGRLSEKTSISRAMDEDPELRPYIKLQVECNECGASIYFLTTVNRDGEHLRACKKCRSEFPVAM